MTDRDIEYLLSLGLWVQVSPLAHGRWVCCVYKQGKKTGNWVSEATKTFDTARECYVWSEKIINELKSG